MMCAFICMNQQWDDYGVYCCSRSCVLTSMKLFVWYSPYGPFCFWMYVQLPAHQRVTHPILISIFNVCLWILCHSSLAESWLMGGWWVVSCVTCFSGSRCLTVRYRHVFFCCSDVPNCTCCACEEHEEPETDCAVWTITRQDPPQRCAVSYAD